MTRLFAHSGSEISPLVIEQTNQFAVPTSNPAANGVTGNDPQPPRPLPVTPTFFIAALVSASLALAACSPGLATDVSERACGNTGAQTFTDPETGCEYFCGYRTGITPRLRADGMPRCPHVGGGAT